MKEFFFITFLIVTSLIIYFVTKNDRDHRNELTKKGFLKITAMVLISFFVSMLFTLLTA
ncbi:hypothetical protein [Gracilibacillus halophilus]|uniref:hypothetical protein n=1 Tax=Gracilibacillus halophilus TaxID=470864 RepID=UPI00039AD0D6|nr:hypothetical protein [Gracilibacillus halophilus]